MTDSLPPRPAPIPPPDRHQIERLNATYDLSFPSTQARWRARFIDWTAGIVARLLFRQRAFNALVVDHINRNAIVGIEAHHASVRTFSWVEDTMKVALERIDSLIDESRRHHQALAANERRSHEAMQELRTSIGVLQQATQTLKREVARIAETGVPMHRDATASPAAAASQTESLDSHKYVGFEDRFRGSPDDIRNRVMEYVPVFQGTQQVLDIGCGRGEFLSVLREHGIAARGVDINAAMIDVCRSQGLAAEETDALSYLKAQPDGSLGGLFGAQIIEHLEPRYLTALLDAAFDKLRPGAPIVLETINPACWFAFFESYIRDITHVRAVHPETLQYLLVACGFQQVEIRYSAPYPDHEKLQMIGPNASLGDTVETLNANASRINRLLFTWLDYAAIGRRP